MNWSWDSAKDNDYDDSMHDDSSHMQGGEYVSKHSFLLPLYTILGTLNELVSLYSEEPSHSPNQLDDTHYQSTSGEGLSL